jgi:hypothetical protein
MNNFCHSIDYEIIPVASRDVYCFSWGVKTLRRNISKLQNTINVAKGFIQRVDYMQSKRLYPHG